MRNWQTQDAKARFSELIAHAVTEGPQSITRHGRSVAVVIGKAEYDRLRSSRPTLVDYLLNSSIDIDLDLERSQDHGREISL
ncbi:type II toxin-antitoxin system Phd/YefM family antitoxin [Arthrobacter tecti]